MDVTRAASATSDPLSDMVSEQYSRWVYPEPIHDLPGWLEGSWQWLDPSHAHRILWPDRPYLAGMDILVAGCGANQAAVLAHTNPQARVVGIDVSPSSLDHQGHLKTTHALDNLELHRLPIEEAGSLHREFDLVVSTGVLHHLADPLVGMQSLGACLRTDGVLAVMLYARYGRFGVELLQSVFRELGLRQDEASLNLVEEALAVMPEDHPVRAYLAIAPDLDFDAGLVDTFLHGRDRSFTVDDCLALVDAAGLVFQDWFLRSPYYPPTASANGFWSSVGNLSVAQQWSIMERINTGNACHFFTACRPDRPKTSYRIDWDAPGAADYVPSLRYRCSVEGQEVVRPGWRMPLEPWQAALARFADGRRTIVEIVAHAAELGLAPDSVDAAVDLFRMLWQRDFIQVELRRP